jgi:hypothetical protein
MLDGNGVFLVYPRGALTIINIFKLLAKVIYENTIERL